MPVRHPVQIIEEQISALHALRKIARQPLALEAMRLIIMEHYGLGVANGNGTAAHRPVDRGGVKLRGAIWDTGITKALEKLLPTLQGDFTYTEVVDRLNEDGYQIMSTNPRTAVGRVLRRLTAKHKIIQVRRGIAGEPNVYRLAT